MLASVDSSSETRSCVIRCVDCVHRPRFSVTRKRNVSENGCFRPQVRGGRYMNMVIVTKTKIFGPTEILKRHRTIQTEDKRGLLISLLLVGFVARATVFERTETVPYGHCNELAV
jgi:hypothetical protein